MRAGNGWPVLFRAKGRVLRAGIDRPVSSRALGGVLRFDPDKIMLMLI